MVYYHYSGGESSYTYYQPKFRPSLRCLLRVKWHRLTAKNQRITLVGPKEPLYYAVRLLFEKSANMQTKKMVLVFELLRIMRIELKPLWINKTKKCENKYQFFKTLAVLNLKKSWMLWYNTTLYPQIIFSSQYLYEWEKKCEFCVVSSVTQLFACKTQFWGDWWVQVSCLPQNGSQ